MDPVLLAVGNRKKPKPPPKKTKSYGPTTTKTTSTKTVAPKVPTLAERQLSEAAQIAAMALDPQVSSINEAVLAAETARVNRTRAAEGVTRALAAMTAGDADAARAAYSEAAGRLAQYGSGLTGQLRDLTQGAADQVNAAISQFGGGRVGSNADAIANVAQMLGAVIPGEGLAASAPRALEQGQAHRLAAGLRLADDASAADYKAGQDIASLRAKIEEIEAKRPGLIMEALSDIRQQANAQRATDTQIGYLQLQQAKSVNDQAIAMTNLTGQLHVVVGTGKNAKVVNTGKVAAGSDAIEAQRRAETSRLNALTAAETQRAATAQREASQARAEEGRNERAALARKAQVEAARIRSQQAQNKPPTVAQKNTVINGSRAAGTNAANAIADRIWANIPGTEAKGKDESSKDYNARIAKATQVYKTRLRNNWGTMMAAVINQIARNLDLIGYSKEQINTFARQIVSQLTPAPAKASAPGGR